MWESRKCDNAGLLCTECARSTYLFCCYELQELIYLFVGLSFEKFFRIPVFFFRIRSDTGITGSSKVLSVLQENKSYLYFSRVAV
jgi:hypothetical protein